MDMVTRAMDSPRGSCWPNSSVPCDPGIQPCSVPVAAQPRSASPSRTGRGRLGRHRASSAPGYHWATGLHLILLSSSLTHTHTHPHTSPPPPCRDTATSPPSTPPFPPSPKHRMLQARLSRADKADALGNSAQAWAFQQLSYSWPRGST